MNNVQESPWKLGGLSVGELLKRTWKETNDDNAYDAAAALGYYFLFALFPVLILLMALMTTISSPVLMDETLGMLSRIMPGDSYKLLTDQLPIVARQSKGGILTFGIIITLWAASSGVVSVIDGLNRAYEVKDKRSFIKRRLVSIGLTLALAILTMVGAGLIVGSDQLAKLLVHLTGISWMQSVGTTAGIVVGLLAMFSGLELIYYFGPNVEYPNWHWVTPGSLAAVIIFILGSLGFSLYVRLSNDYSSTAYGGLGSVMVLMLWLFILGLAIVIGGEINSEIAKAALAHGSPEAPRVGRGQARARQQNRPISGLPAH
jgi:membrane protein